jgi:hypothetical protein
MYPSQEGKWVSACVSYRGSPLWGEAHAAHVLHSATRGLQRRHGKRTRQLPALAAQHVVETVVQEADRLKTAGTGTQVWSGGARALLFDHTTHSNGSGSKAFSLPCPMLGMPFDLKV